MNPAIVRAVGWPAIIVLLIAGRIVHNEYLTAAIEPLALGMLWLVSPRQLRGAIGLIAAIAAITLLLGGVDWMIETLPVLIAAMVGWLFARSLLRGRTAVLARAMAAIDGAHALDDAAMARYARRLTLIWAVFQFALALFGLLCVLAAHQPMRGLTLPSPGVFAVLLPIAIVLLFCGEFALRPRLLPQAPRHPPIRFLREMVRIWPELIEE